MSRLAMAGALISVALGSAFALPATAQAATSASTAGISRAAAPDIPLNGKWQEVASYPDTSAGLAACNAEGIHLLTTEKGTATNYSCDGAYVLVVYFV